MRLRAGREAQRERFRRNAARLFVLFQYGFDGFPGKYHLKKENKGQFSGFVSRHS